MFERRCAFVITALMAAAAVADAPVADPALEWFQQTQELPNRYVPVEAVPYADRVQVAVTSLMLGDPSDVPITRLPFDPADLALLKAAQRSERDFAALLMKEIKEPLCKRTIGDPESVDAETVLSALAAMEAQVRSHWTSTWGQLSEDLSATGHEILAGRVDQILLDHWPNWRAVADYDPEGFIRYYWWPSCSLIESPPPPNE